jgi:threonine/homoserine/homoserine lactone efflux protein
MSYAANLWLFSLVLLGVIVLPGLDMAFVLASSLVDGRRSGLAAVSGIVAGGVCHVLMTALGLGVLLAVWPSAFNAVLVAGAIYIAWIGWSLLRAGAAFDGVPATNSRPLSATFRRGMLTSLLNPKAYVFMLAIFPQFLRREYGAWWLQVVVLGTIIAVSQVLVYGALALAADRSRDWLGQHPAVNSAVARVVGIVLLCAAAWTAWRGWRFA